MSYAIPSFLTSQEDKNYLHPANFPYLKTVQMMVNTWDL